MAKTLAAYFSASGVTAKAAKLLAEALNSDLYEIRPAEPYTKGDLNWMNPWSRSTKEMKDPSSRPALADRDCPVSDYDTIYLGFPIWWYVAPTIVNTFLESYDFSGKTVVLFMTSGNSGFGETLKKLRPSVSEHCKLVEGIRITRKTTAQELKAWAEQL